MKYFDGVKTLKEGTKKYRDLMKKLHPDVGGSHDETIEMQHQFEVFVKTATREEVEEKTGEDSTWREMHRSDRFVQQLQNVLQMNVDVEVIGDFIWVFNAVAIMDPFKLTTYGFRYSKKHEGFFWTEISKYMDESSADTGRRSHYSTNDLRAGFGSEEKAKKRYM